MRNRFTAHLPPQRLILLLAVLHLACWDIASAASGTAQPSGRLGLSFRPSARTVECYDFVEVAVNVAKPVARNPFTEVMVLGRFGQAGRADAVAVDGFCDSGDGRLFRVRFMPVRPGKYA
jgi:hypothetical protein